MPDRIYTPSVIDENCDYALKVAPEIPWLVEPLTPGRGRAFLLQHILRNRLFSAVIRPAWVSRCPDLAVVRKTIGQMREELVYDDVVAQPHTTLLWQMGRNVGLTDAEMDTVRPVPLVEVAFHVWENIARTRHWIAGWLATSVDEFILTAMPGRHNFRAEAWKRAFGLNDEQVFFSPTIPKPTMTMPGAKCGSRSRVTSPTTRTGGRWLTVWRWLSQPLNCSTKGFVSWETNSTDRTELEQIVDLSIASLKN